MDFHELTAFQALADTLHFSRAAALVNMSPSALSRLITRLEDELHTALFDRDTRQVALTTAGEQFRAFCRESLERRSELSSILEAGSLAGDPLHGTLRVYASVTACYTILPPLMESLSSDHPALRLSVETGDPAGAAEVIREGLADLAISAIPEGGFSDLENYSVRKTPLVFAASRSGPWGNLNLPREDLSIITQEKNLSSSPEAAITTLQDDDTLARALEKVPLILPHAGLARQRYERWIRVRRANRLPGKQPEIAAETAGNEALLALARLGMGLALVPRLVLENSPFASGLVLYRAGASFGDYEIGYIQKKLSSGSTQARARKLALAEIILQTYLRQ